MFFVSMERDYVSELLSLVGLLFIPQVTCKCGEVWTGQNRKLGENLSHCHFLYHKFQMDDTVAYPSLRNVKPAVNP
jgi:hypothetical protein